MTNQLIPAQIIDELLNPPHSPILDHLRLIAAQCDTNAYDAAFTIADLNDRTLPLPLLLALYHACDAYHRFPDTPESPAPPDFYLSDSSIDDLLEMLDLTEPLNSLDEQQLNRRITSRLLDDETLDDDAIDDLAESLTNMLMTALATTSDTFHS